jgi:hypothetical protein
MTLPYRLSLDTVEHAKRLSVSIANKARCAVDETTLVLRRATAGDATELRTLAALDSARPLEGDVLVAMVGGHLRAARSLADGRTIADPFVPAAALCDLLALQARQLAATPPARGRKLQRRLQHAPGAC